MSKQTFLKALALSGALCVLTALFPADGWPGPQMARAQLGTNNIPDNRYFNTFYDYYQGDYRSAIRSFERGGNSAFKFGDRRFLDSICYWVMIGECHYQTGDYGSAIEYYETALRLYLNLVGDDWQARVQIPPALNANNNVIQQARINWGESTRRRDISIVPDSFSFVMGNLNNNRVLVDGGVAAPLEARPVNLKEIMRCTALAIHRRRQIKGPTCRLDPFTADLTAGLSRYGGPNGTLMGAWNGVLLGLAYASAEDWQRARMTLNGALQFNGTMDHSLTPVALLEIAQIQFETGDTAGAATTALEASYAAAIIGQYDLVEESLTLGKTIHLLSNKTPYPPLLPAIDWAGQNRVRLLQSSMMVQLAECYAEAGNAADAAAILGECQRVMSRNSLPGTVVNARRLYVGAVTQFLQGKTAGGLTDLAESLQQFQTGSRWLYQLDLADKLAVSGNVSGRQADQLYGLLLRDPTTKDWLTDPIEAIAFLKSDHVPMMERWFEIKIGNRQFDEALAVAELVRRHRFYSTLPMAGRLLSFRWILHGPELGITQDAMQQRLSFLTSNGQYKTLSDRAEEIRNELLTIKLMPERGEDDFKRQTDLFVELAAISDQQEAYLSSFALRRQPAEAVMPPQLDISVFRNQIREHQVALVSFQTANGFHQYVFGREIEKYLGIVTHRDFKRSYVKLMKALGIEDHSGSLEVDDLNDETWKEAAAEMSATLLLDQVPIDYYKQVVIVPDGAMWYVPFEVLQMVDEDAMAEAAAVAAAAAAQPPAAGGDPAAANPPAGANANAAGGNAAGGNASGNAPVDPPVLYKSLLDHAELRYCPNMFLAFGVQRPSRRLSRSAAVVARTHSKGDIAWTQAAFEQLEATIPGIASINEKLRIPTNYLGCILDQMIVWGDQKVPARAGIYSMAPSLADEGLNGGNIASMLSLPFESPEHFVMPGFSSGGAAGSKAKGDGTDLFLMSSAMIASGTRSIMVSRWRTGGANSLELSRLYSEKLLTMTPARALREATAEARELEIQLEQEPRLDFNELPDPVKANHPFFWAGNIVIEIPNLETLELPVDPNAAAAGVVPGRPAVVPNQGAGLPGQNPVVPNPGAVNPGAVNPGGANAGAANGQMPARPANGTEGAEETPDDGSNALPENPDLPDEPAGSDEIMQEGGQAELPSESGPESETEEGGGSR